MIPKLADSVVHSAEKFELLVDETPFPWLISYAGPRFARLRDDLYRVDVSIFTMTAKDRGFGPISFFDHEGQTPMIAGVAFPWIITEDGISYHRSRTTVPTIRLGFFARTVVSDKKIPDLRSFRHGSKSIHDVEGNYWGEHGGPGELYAEVLAFDDSGQIAGDC